VAVDSGQDGGVERKQRATMAALSRRKRNGGGLPLTGARVRISLQPTWGGDCQGCLVAMTPWWAVQSQPKWHGPKALGVVGV
jgi:hypothetical protein